MKHNIDKNKISKDKMNLQNKILGFIIIFFNLFIIIFLIIFSLPVFQKYVLNKFQIMGIQLNNYLPIFIILTGIVVMIFIVKSYIKTYFKVKFKKFNNYTIITIYLIFLVFLLGIGLIGDYYSTDLPLNIQPYTYNSLSNFNESIKLSNLKCDSKTGYHNFVEKDRIKCTINLDSLKDQIEIIFIKVQQYLSNDSFLTTFDKEYKIDKIKEGYAHLDIIENEFYLDSTIIVTLYSKKKQSITFYYYIKGPILQRNEYHDKENQKMPLILAVLSFAGFSVIMAIKNFRDIVENT
jgi:hypothetical protein